MPDKESNDPVVSVPKDTDRVDPVQSPTTDTTSSTPLVDEEEKPVLDLKIPEGANLPAVGTVFMKNHRYPEGTIIEVPGLGGIPNMGSKEVDQNQVYTYEAQTLQKWDGDLTVEIKDTEPTEEAE
jgi:hypothetical protein